MKVPANRKFSKNRKSAVMAIAATALLGWVLLAAGISHAQGEASIWGVITDSSGALIPAATVKVENVETGAVRDLVSDTEGRYDATLLAVGNYRVTVEKNGFQAETKTGITLGGGPASAGRCGPGTHATPAKRDRHRASRSYRGHQ